MLSGASARLGPSRIPDRAVNDEMRDMDALRRKLAGDALRQPAKCELSHRERGRARVAFDAGRGARKQDGAAAVWQHPLGCGLRDEKPAIGCDGQGACNIGRVEVDQGPAHPSAGIVDDHVRRAPERFVHSAEQGGHLLGIRDIAGVGAAPRSSESPASFVVFRAANPIRSPAPYSAREIAALRPSPAPTINAR